MIDWIKTAQRLAAAVVIFATIVAWWDVERGPSQLSAGAAGGPCAAAALPQTSAAEWKAGIFLKVQRR
jgi:hypothetical protein